MTFQIIVKQRRNKLGKKRSEVCENIRRERGGSGGLSDEHLDKMKWLEKKHNRVGFIPAVGLDSDLSEYND